MTPYIWAVTALLAAHTACDGQVVSRPSSSPAGGDCRRDLSREAVDIAEDILTAAASSGIHMASTCPLHPDNDRYARQELLKKELRHGPWQCTSCRKQFKSERWLDGHLDRAHTELIPRDKACMADYCGLLGCPGLRHEADKDVEPDDAEEDTGQDEPSSAPAASPQVEVAPRQLAAEPEPPASDDSEAGTQRLRKRRPAGVGPETAQDYRDAALSDGAPSPRAGAHRDAVTAAAGVLTKRQARERDRCWAIITSCFPLPEAPPDSASAAEATPAEHSPAASSVDPAARPRLRPRAPSPQPRAVVSAFRHKLAQEYCDAPAQVKVGRALEKQSSGALASIWTIVGVVFVLSAALSWLLQWSDNAGALGRVQRMRDDMVAAAEARNKAKAAGHDASPGSRDHGRRGPLKEVADTLRSRTGGHGHGQAKDCDTGTASAGAGQRQRRKSR